MGAAHHSDVSPSRGRTHARRRAVQALYQWAFTGAEAAAIEEQFAAEQDMREVDTVYFHELLHGVTRAAAELDALYAPYIDRSPETVDPVERAILRLGAFELRDRLEVPYRVAVNEAVVLAKAFGAEDGHRFVNGVLDRLARDLRAAERGTGA